jgi:hypothetical protein
MRKENIMADGYTTFPQTNTNQALETFLAKLTEAARETGIGIATPAEVFVLEAEDKAFAYTCDEDGKLLLA